jgi:protein-disulfide isomerase
MTSLPERFSRDLKAAASSPVALGALIVFVVGAVSAIAFFPKETAAGGEGAVAQTVSDDKRSEVERWFDSQPRTIIPVGDTGGAAVVIVKFNDYQCPPCKQTYVGYKPIIAKYQAQNPGKVLNITKHFPIDPECNPNTPGGTHVLACEAAAGVIMAKQRSKGEPLEDWIFANQATLTGDGIKQAVRTIGEVPDFEARYGKVMEEVKADIALGKLLGVNATPTFFINGVKVSGGLQPQFLDAIIAHELKKNQAPTPAQNPGDQP